MKVNWLKSHWYQVGLLICLLVVSFAFYNYLVIVPKEKLEYQKQKDLREQALVKLQEAEDKTAKENNKTSRDWCLVTAHSTYIDRVKINASSKDDFQTWTWNSIGSREYVEDQYKSDKDECFKKYPINN